VNFVFSGVIYVCLELGDLDHDFRSHLTNLEWAGSPIPLPPLNIENLPNFTSEVEQLIPILEEMEFEHKCVHGVTHSFHISLALLRSLHYNFHISFTLLRNLRSLTCEFYLENYNALKCV